MRPRLVRVRQETQCTVDVADRLEVQRQPIADETSLRGSGGVEDRPIKDVGLLGSIVGPELIRLFHVFGDLLNRLRERSGVIDCHFGSINKPGVMSIPGSKVCLHVQGRQRDLLDQSPVPLVLPALWRDVPRRYSGRP